MENSVSAASKPDILGDISDNVHTENARNARHNGDVNGDGGTAVDSVNGGDGHSENGHHAENGGPAENGELIKYDSNGELEKGALDSRSNKSEDDDSQASLKQHSLQR